MKRPGPLNLVFDVGGVLLDWRPADLLRATFPQALSSPEEAAQMAQQVFGHADWLAFDGGVLSADELTQRITRRLALDATALAAMIDSIGYRLQPIPETLHLLAQLGHQRDGHSPLRLYYLSNMPKPYARLLERRFDFFNGFDGGLFSSDVQLTKPDTAIYRLLQSRYDLNPADTLFIDDLQGNVLAAQALGWQGHHFVSPQHLRLQLMALNLLGDRGGQSTGQGVGLESL